MKIYKNVMKVGKFIAYYCELLLTFMTFHEISWNFVESHKFLFNCVKSPEDFYKIWLKWLGKLVKYLFTFVNALHNGWN
jgi:hypothetical protein